MILSEGDAHSLTTKLLSLVKSKTTAESAVVTLTGFNGLHLRYAQNRPTTSGAPSGLTLTLTLNFGTRSGTTSTNDSSDEGLASLVAAAVTIGKLTPPNPEFMPPLGPQIYGKGSAYAESTASLRPSDLAEKVRPILEAAPQLDLKVAGYLQTQTSFTAMATSAGLFAYDLATDVSHTLTARTEDGTGSGWAGINLEKIEGLDTTAQGRVAMEKAICSAHPQPLEPGKYTVILEPAAVQDLIGWMISEFDQRAADEGRSFLSKDGGGTRLGTQVFGNDITITSDPNDPLAPGAVFSDDGLPAPKKIWVEKGVLRALPCSRYWAQQQKREAIPSPTSFVVAGGTTTREEMLSEVERGLLITRIWYVREVDPQTLLLTGLTRDGVFLIEKGKLIRSSQNFRFNVSPVEMLNNVRARGPSVRSLGSEDQGTIGSPPLLIDGFHLTSISDAV